jgi:hypothetical protein
MTQDEIIEMARQAGITVEAGGRSYEQLFRIINAFAKLVAQHEREACAKLLEEAAQAAKDVDPQGFVWIAIKTSAEGIRARGQA